MIKFGLETDADVAERLLPWDVDSERRTDELSFVNPAAGLKILMVRPGPGRKLHGVNDDQWVGKLVDVRPHSTMEPSIVAVEQTEIDLVEKLEEIIQANYALDGAFLVALDKLQQAGLVIESPRDVAAEYVLSGLDTVDRLRGYFRLGAGPCGKPEADVACFDEARLRAELVSQGFSEGESWLELALLAPPRRRQA